MRTGLRYLLCAAAIAPALAAAPASAVTFNLNDIGGAEVGTQARQGFEIAAAFWSSVLTNDSVVNLDIGFTGLGTGILGSTGSNRADVQLSSVVAAMAATGNSTLDAIALTNLASKINPDGSINAITNGPRNTSTGFGVDTNTLEWDADGSENNSWIWGNTAVLKAMGLTENEYAGGSFADATDGSITFSSNFAFDFDPTDGIATGTYDFIGVAVHEIGHALGFVSGVDLYDAYGYPSGPYRTSGGFSFDDPGGGLMSTLDLFRYSADVNNIAPGAGPALDWSVTRPTTIAAGGNPYFSIDGGFTQFNGDSIYSTGRYNGDGQQASHWKDEGGCSDQIGIMDPNFCSRQMGEVTGTDLAAFDAMGWNININALTNSGYVMTTSQMYTQFASGVPESATWLQMIAGFGLLGFAMRSSKRARSAVAFA